MATGEVTAMVWAALTVVASLMVTVAVWKMATQPVTVWSSPELAEEFAGWVARSVEDHTLDGAAGSHEPAAATLERAVAALTRPVAPPPARARGPHVPAALV